MSSFDSSFNTTGKVFKQKYHGNLTLVPRFTTMQTFGLHALVNPDEKQMENYLKFGQLAAWPYLRYVSLISYLFCVESNDNSVSLMF